LNYQLRKADFSINRLGYECSVEVVQKLELVMWVVSEAIFKDLVYEPKLNLFSVLLT